MFGYSWPRKHLLFGIKKVLILRESSEYEDGTNAARYDVVGGRLEPGQHFKDSLIREIDEETGLKCEIGVPFFVNEWRPVKNGEQWQVVGIFFRCMSASGDVRLSQDHDAYKWIDPADYREHSLIPNLQAAFEAYLPSSQKN